MTAPAATTGPGWHVTAWRGRYRHVWRLNGRGEWAEVHGDVPDTYRTLDTLGEAQGPLAPCDVDSPEALLREVATLRRRLTATDGS